MKYTLQKIILLSLLVVLLATSCGTPTAEPPATALPTASEAIEATAPLSVPTSTPATVTEALPETEKLDFDSFMEESFQELLKRDPQLLTELGLGDNYGVGDDKLNDLSEEYVNGTYQQVTETLAALREYDRDALHPEQALTYDIYEWYLDDFLRGEPFKEHNYPVSFLITTGVQVQLMYLFTDLHPVRDQKDVEDYISRLSQVDTQLEQLIEGLERREEAGVVMPGFLIPWVLGDLRNIGSSNPRATPFYTALEEKLKPLSSITPTQQETMLVEAEKEIRESVIPAYRALAETMSNQQALSTNDEGVWKLPNGETYYAYTLRHHTTTDLTAEEIHELGQRELDRIHAEMRAIFDELGYPEEGSLPELYALVAQDGGFYQGEAIGTTFESLIQEAEEKVQEAFDLQPQADVVVFAGEAGSYYTPPAVDGSRPGLFYARVSNSQPYFSMPTLAYHEAIPGHHFQLAIALESSLPSFRKGGYFNAFTEGWALYSERLAWELGFYEDDPYGNLGRLQAEAFRASRLVVDTGIHAKKWNFNQAVDYMVENTGMPRRQVEGEVARYILWPGQATSYMIGMLKILELRQRAMDAMGDSFDLKAFHNLVLENGAVPLDILEDIVEDYIAENS